LLGSWWLAACATGATALAPPSVPKALEVAPDEVVVAKVHASGAQVYECKEDAWALRGPEATLKSDHGDPIGRHFSGPTWAFDDGSQVTGAVAQKSDAPRPDAIPWLLLRATSHAGAGMLARVTSIQRVDTQGGKAPPGACAGQAPLSVPYSATYYFYAPAH
jgi:hypothetical protein